MQSYGRHFICKKVNCNSNLVIYSIATWLLSNEAIDHVATGQKIKRKVTKDTIQKSKEKFDTVCKTYAKNIGEEIVTADNVVYYQSGAPQFGSATIESNYINKLQNKVYLRYYSPPNEFPANYTDENGMDISYKIFCIDVDGFDEAKGLDNCDDIKDICPFGYGIRADGKILTGERADSWLEKSIQGE